jgi:polysaccharide biosynthesis transport protein
VLPTEVPNLSVMPAGPLPPNPAELIHSDRFKAFLAVARSRFDRVVVDSPPVVPVTDGAVLSTLVDGTVLVVRAFKTSKDLARHALRALQDVGSNVAGTVLNAVDLSRTDYKYSHYYYYRREGYYTDDLPAQTSATGDGASAQAPE